MIRELHIEPIKVERCEICKSNQIFTFCKECKVYVCRRCDDYILKS